MKKARMFVVALLAGTLLTSVAVAAPLFEEDFDSYTVNTYLNGQGGWSVFDSSSNGDFYVRNAVYNWGGLNTSKTIRPLDSGSNWVKKAASLNISSTGTAVLGFDVYHRGGDNSTGAMVMSLGDGTNVPAYCGLWGHKFMIRADGNGTEKYAVDSDGNEIVAADATAYRIRSVWDFNTDTATLEYMNLTAGETVYTTLYFDAAQSVSTVSLGNLDGADMDHVLVRAYQKAAGSHDEIDNINVIPEPATMALLLLGLPLALRRRR